MKKTRLKGGSLSGTYLIEDKIPFVRKEVSLIEDREYGFQRWYSQLKRMQRYSILFPDLFPKIIDYGMSSSHSYFDMEYIDNSTTLHEFIINNDWPNILKAYHALTNVMDKIHKTHIHSSKNAIQLYVHEEIEQRLKDSISDRFVNFLSYKTIVFNGKEVPSFIYHLDEYKGLFKLHYNNPMETFSHGNLTLENILYQPKTNRIVLIDPYEENIIDSCLADYSQIYQSSHSRYELYNSSSPSIINNIVSCDIKESIGLNYFNELFSGYIDSKCNEEDKIVIRLFEISQFIRMLPFKMAIDEDKMIFFYSLASFLYNELKEA